MQKILILFKLFNWIQQIRYPKSIISVYVIGMLTAVMVMPINNIRDQSSVTILIKDDLLEQIKKVQIQSRYVKCRSFASFYIMLTFFFPFQTVFYFKILFQTKYKKRWVVQWHYNINITSHHFQYYGTNTQTIAIVQTHKIKKRWE